MLLIKDKMLTRIRISVHVALFNVIRKWRPLEVVHNKRDIIMRPRKCHKSHSQCQDYMQCYYDFIIPTSGTLAFHQGDFLPGIRKPEKLLVVSHEVMKRLWISTYRTDRGWNGNWVKFEQWFWNSYSWWSAGLGVTHGLEGMVRVLVSVSFVILMTVSHIFCHVYFLSFFLIFFFKIWSQTSVVKIIWIDCHSRDKRHCRQGMSERNGMSEWIFA